MANVKTEMKGKMLHIEIDTTADLGPSTSGKSNKVASTDGNIVVEGAGGLVLGLNAYRPIPKAPKASK